MNIYIKFVIIEWRTPYPLTNFEDRLDCVPQLFFYFISYSKMCGALFICTQASSKTLMANLRN